MDIIHFSGNSICRIKAGGIVSDTVSVPSAQTTVFLAATLLRLLDVLRLLEGSLYRIPSNKDICYVSFHLSDLTMFPFIWVALNEKHTSRRISPVMPG